MPELPEVETYKRYVDSTALNQVIEKVTITDERIVRDGAPGTIRARLKGAMIESTERRGKHLFCKLSNGGWLALHFGMTGDLAYYKGPKEPPKYARLILDFENEYHLAYTSMRMFGGVRFVEDMDAFVRQQRIGLDALSDQLDLARFRELMNGRKGIIKPTLMDQSIIAGIGNIYADEILFQAGVHPEARVDGLDGARLGAIHRAMKRVLRVAVKRNAEIEKLPPSYLLPRRYKGPVDCPRCGGRIETKKIAGRTAYLCLNCQKK